jgi:hypothetical protein
MLCLGTCVNVASTKACSAGSCDWLFLVPATVWLLRQVGSCDRMVPETGWFLRHAGSCNRLAPVTAESCDRLDPVTGCCFQLSVAVKWCHVTLDRLAPVTGWLLRQAGSCNRLLLSTQCCCEMMSRDTWQAGFCDRLVPATGWFLRQAGSCNRLIPATGWFLQQAVPGSCDRLVPATGWFLRQAVAFNLVLLWNDVTWHLNRHWPRAECTRAVASSSVLRPTLAGCRAVQWAVWACQSSAASDWEHPRRAGTLSKMGWFRGVRVQTVALQPLQQLFQTGDKMMLIQRVL